MNCRDCGEYVDWHDHNKSMGYGDTKCDCGTCYYSFVDYDEDGNEIEKD